MKMNSVADELVSFMDLLDLDEELVDSRLATIMNKSNFTDKHLMNAIRILQYKHLINVKEGSECENDTEFSFIAKLIENLCEENVDSICQIVNIVLSLNTDSILCKSEHLIQQILCIIQIPPPALSNISNNEDVQSLKTLLYLKVCDSILDVIIDNRCIISLPFLETPLENIINCCHETLRIHFLNNTVPRLFKAVHGYNILDRIWNCLKRMKTNEALALKVLSCLSDYYLPFTDDKGVVYESNIVFEHEFWEIILAGLITETSESLNKKMAVYLAKRALDYLMTQTKDICVKSQSNIIFIWENKNKQNLKKMWDNFFVLLDSLEEKQSNIVLPSLRLFEAIKDIGQCWLNCALNLGLKHDNTQVRFKCIEYRLQMKINEESEALTLLEAFNDTYLFDQSKVRSLLKNNLSIALSNVSSLMYVIKSITKIKWSPVPLYHLSEVLASVRVDLLYVGNQSDVFKIVIDIVKLPCNNIPIRKAICVNISHFVGNCCRGFHWEEYSNIYPYFQFHTVSEESRNINPFILYLKENHLIQNDEINSLFKLIATEPKHIDFGLFYIQTHAINVTEFLSLINRMIMNVQNINNRQYADPTTCFNDVICLTHIFSKTLRKDNPVLESINMITGSSYKTVLEYLISILRSDVNLGLDKISILLVGLKSMFTSLSDCNVIEVILQLYKSCIFMLDDKSVDVEKKVFAVYILCVLLESPLMNEYYKHEILSLEQFFKLPLKLETDVSHCKINNGRLKNVVYEKYCEILYSLLEYNKPKTIDHLIEYINKATESGGYGCLKWILKIFKITISNILEEKNFNVSLFLNRMWNEIEELKSNNQYVTCIEEFINVITDDCLLNRPVYNNTVILYCSKIIEFGLIKNTPLYFLTRQLSNRDISKFSQITYVLCEILLFAPLPRRDHRITDNLIITIQHLAKYGLSDHSNITPFNFHIQYLSYCTLSKIDNPEILDTVVSFIINKVNEMFKNKKRYHGNSHLHRTLLTAMQVIILILLKTRKVNLYKIVHWCMDLLGMLPHQQSVKICLEWCIALYFYFKNIALSKEMIQQFNTKNIPITSQFMILYWLAKHRILCGTLTEDEKQFVMDTLLNHTMGQVFNVRLIAQYLAAKLYESDKDKLDKYKFTYLIIKNTFEESAEDKSFVKLKNDYFVNEFDMVINFSPHIILYFLPRVCEMYINENIDIDFVRNILNNIQTNLHGNDSTDTLTIEKAKYPNNDENVFNCVFETEDDRTVHNEESMGTIQKKYVPWKNMNDIHICDSEKKISKSELILVASLIDKLPNLGGMARTSEVFGVKTYVVDSLRHLQDKQFQGLSVSAERWVNVEEVRPKELKGYLIRKKEEGYSVVAAEQTSTSCQLQTFKFAKKTVLLLGHEKEGIPCDLLPLMDHCVEIPQQGVVRSLNVHVTAAIFVWEYTRQIMI